MMEADSENTRKRKDISSISDLDTSGTALSSPSAGQQKQSKAKKKKKKTAKVEKPGQQAGSNTKSSPQSKTQASGQSGQTEMDSSEISRQLTEINKKLANVMTKDDGSLRNLIKEVFQQMKDEFLDSAYKRIEILEGRLFERDEESDKMKKKVNDLDKTVNDLKKTADGLKKQVTDKQVELNEQKEENKKLTEKLETLTVNSEAKMNDLEQYTRKNSVRISGISETGNETAEQSIEIVVDKLNSKIEDLNLQKDDIDIAHRVGKRKKTGNDS